MGLITDIKIDGNIVKETFSGLGGLARDLRTAFTGRIDPEKQAEFDRKVLELEALANKGQTDINQAEAANPNLFVSGWRPYIGWCCGTALAAYYIPQSLMAAILWTVQCVMIMVVAPDITKAILPAFPIIFDMAEILGLVSSLLGLGGLRTWEKKNRVARS